MRTACLTQARTVFVSCSVHREKEVARSGRGVSVVDVVVAVSEVAGDVVVSVVVLVLVAVVVSVLVVVPAGVLVVVSVLVVLVVVSVVDVVVSVGVLVVVSVVDVVVSVLDVVVTGLVVLVVAGGADGVDNGVEVDARVDVGVDDGVVVGVEDAASEVDEGSDELEKRPRLLLRPRATPCSGERGVVVSVSAGVVGIANREEEEGAGEGVASIAIELLAPSKSSSASRFDQLLTAHIAASNFQELYRQGKVNNESDLERVCQRGGGGGGGGYVDKSYGKMGGLAKSRSNWKEFEAVGKNLEVRTVEMARLARTSQFGGVVKEKLYIIGGARPAEPCTPCPNGCASQPPRARVVYSLAEIIRVAVGGERVSLRMRVLPAATDHHRAAHAGGAEFSAPTSTPRVYRSCHVYGAQASILRIFSFPLPLPLPLPSPPPVTLPHLLFPPTQTQLSRARTRTTSIGVHAMPHEPGTRSMRIPDTRHLRIARTWCTEVCRKSPRMPTGLGATGCDIDGRAPAAVPKSQSSAARSVSHTCTECPLSHPAYKYPAHRGRPDGQPCVTPCDVTCAAHGDRAPALFIASAARPAPYRSRTLQRVAGEGKRGGGEEELAGGRADELGGGGADELGGGG
ncbi:hypothetical protein DFH06DRAFT_1125525 [Mycena polygramma]|nr:hypothetical protein DFH06DRAFT_1125525 [Mycena polygramma]